jgi:tetratricopeptide (TPR) repeat protein
VALLDSVAEALALFVAVEVAVILLVIVREGVQLLLPLVESVAEAVIEALGAARALDRTDWEAMLLEARILAARHNRADAWKALADALAQHPRLAEAWRMRGELSAGALEQADALAIAEGIDAFSPACAAAALLRARTALMQDDADGAEPMLRQVLATAPTQPDALAYLAAMHAVRFRPEAMEQALADADRAAGHLSLAAVYAPFSGIGLSASPAFAGNRAFKHTSSHSTAKYR